MDTGQGSTFEDIFRTYNYLGSGRQSILQAMDFDYQWYSNPIPTKYTTALPWSGNESYSD